MYSMFLSLLNLKLQDDSRYTLLTGQGPFELRLYQRMTCATVSLNHSFEDSWKEGTTFLQSYIDGANIRVDKIVNSGPCFQIQNENNWEICMSLPAGMNLTNAPMPINRLIKLVELPPRKIGTLKFSGAASEDMFIRRGEELKKWLSYKGWNPMGALRITRNDQTISVPFMKNNEVHIDVL